MFMKTKNSGIFFIIVPFLLLLYGCPYSSSYKLDTEPSVLVDDALVGKWATMVADGAGNDLPLKMIVDKKNDFEYGLSFTGNINDLRYYNVIKEDTIKATAFLSEAAGRRFLNIALKGQFYIAELVYRDSKISILPLCEHFTVKMIKNDAELKQALELHFKTRLYPLYDDAFCLKDMVRVN